MLCAYMCLCLCMCRHPCASIVLTGRVGLNEAGDGFGNVQMCFEAPWIRDPFVKKHGLPVILAMLQ